MVPQNCERLATQIEERIQELSAERLDFFICWLEDHTALANLLDKSQRQAILSAWFEKLPPEEAQEEYVLFMDEIRWCAKTPLSELRRIASNDARRSFDE